MILDYCLFLVVVAVREIHIFDLFGLPRLEATQTDTLFTWWQKGRLYQPVASTYLRWQEVSAVLCAKTTRAGPAHTCPETCFTRPPLILTFRSRPENCPLCWLVFACVSLCLSVIYVCLFLWIDSVWIVNWNFHTKHIFTTPLSDIELVKIVLVDVSGGAVNYQLREIGAAVKAAFWWVLSICLRGWDCAGRR